MYIEFIIFRDELICFSLVFSLDIEGIFNALLSLIGFRFLYSKLYAFENLKFMWHDFSYQLLITQGNGVPRNFLICI